MTCIICDKRFCHCAAPEEPTWKSAAHVPYHTNDVIVANVWGDYFFASCERHEDGSRSWDRAEMSHERLDRYLWAELTPPTEKDWEK